MQSIPHSIRRIAVAATAVLILGGIAVGIAAAQSQPATTPSGQQQAQPPANPEGGEREFGRHGPGRGFRFELQAAASAIGITPDQLRSELPGKSLAQVAQAHGKTANDVATALKNAAHTRIDQAVSAGRITSDQANTRKTEIDQRIDQMVNQVMSQGGPGGRGKFGFGHGAFGLGLNTAASVLGITPDQLRSELPGKSLAQVAQAHGKTANDVAAALKNEAHTRIDQRIDQLMNQVAPAATR